METNRHLCRFDDQELVITIHQESENRWIVHDPSTPDASLSTYASEEDAIEDLRLQGVEFIRPL